MLYLLSLKGAHSQHNFAKSRQLIVIVSNQISSILKSKLFIVPDEQNGQNKLYKHQYRLCTYALFLMHMRH